MPAKAVKKAKKEIMAMVMEEIKGGDFEAEKPKGNRAEKASETLLTLVRGEKKRKAASMINVINVDLKKDPTDFVPSNPEPKSAAVLMIPGQWTRAQEFRPVNRSSARGNNTLESESGEASSNTGKDIALTENDEVGKRKMTKTDPLSIKNGKKKNVEKRSTSGSKFFCGEDCKFKARGKGFDLDGGDRREKSLRSPLS